MENNIDISNCQPLKRRNIKTIYERDIENGWKICSCCKTSKSLNNFNIETRKKSGLKSFATKCKKCRSEGKIVKKIPYIVEKHGIKLKLCTKCKTHKNFNNFFHHSSSPLNLARWCRECSSKHEKTYRLLNPKIAKERRKRAFLKRKEKIKSKIEQDKINGFKICIECKNKLPLFNFRYVLKNDNYLNICNNCYKNKSSKIRLLNPKFLEFKIFEENGVSKKKCTKCKEIKLITEYNKHAGQKSGINSFCRNCVSLINKFDRPKTRMRILKKYHTPNGNLNTRMSSQIKRSLKRNKAGRRWETLVDFTLSDLKIHLEKQFTENMNWESFIKGDIHIDHILPLELFQFESEKDIQFKICWGLNNLRPLWASDNSSKNDTLPNGLKASNLSPQEKIVYLRSLGYQV